MNITPGKYRTRNGGEAIVLTVLDVTYDRVIGYRVINGEVDGMKYNYANPMTWETDGRRYTTIDDDNDLMERME